MRMASDKLPLDDLSDEAREQLTPLEKHLIDVLLKVNNTARNWPYPETYKQALDKIVDITATVFEGDKASAEDDNGYYKNRNNDCRN